MTARKMHYSCLLFLLCAGSAISAKTKSERCDMCTCTLVNSVLQLNCSDIRTRPGDIPGLIKLPYPESYNVHQYNIIKAEFERNKIKLLSRFSMEDLTKLSLAHNEIANIEAGTFMWLKYLKVISLSDNRIVILHEKSFQGLPKLENLDLSHNNLQSFSQETFTDLKNLKILSLHHNMLTNVNWKMFPSSLQTLDLSSNFIDKIESDSSTNTSHLIALNLSSNNITSISSNTFAAHSSLASLDLSNNNLVKVDSAAFGKQNVLTKLILSHNELEEFLGSTELPPVLEVLDLSNNLLTEISTPIGKLNKLQELYLQRNYLTAVDLVSDTKVQVLNVSGNSISSFSAPFCPNLEVLDLSYNKLSDVPSEIQGLAMPKLRWLSLDANPMAQVHFPSTGDDEREAASLMNLQWLSVSHLPELQELKERDFSGLSSQCGACDVNSKAANTMEEPEELEALKQEVCTRKLEVRVAHNSRLTTINPDAFQDLALCKLDLSHNALSSLDENLMQWESLQEVDLQGNPWDCSCSLQWVLDRILPRLYNSTPELLYELRCNSPANLRNRRLVHFYKWDTPALCSKMEKLMMAPTTPSNDVEVTMGFSGPMLAVVLCLATVGLLLVVAAVVMQRRLDRRYRIRNRRLL